MELHGEGESGGCVRGGDTTVRSRTAPYGGLKTATRAGEEGHEDKHDAPRRQKPPPLQPELFSLLEEEPSGRRPPCLGEPPGPQERVQRHTAEQAFVDDTEQVIAVPKISSPSQSPLRAVLLATQMAEQLVEVPAPPFLECAHAQAEFQEEFLALVRDTTGHTWIQVAAVGLRHVQWTLPEGATASPGRYTNTGQG